MGIWYVPPPGPQLGPAGGQQSNSARDLPPSLLPFVPSNPIPDASNRYGVAAAVFASLRTAWEPPPPQPTQLPQKQRVNGPASQPPSYSVLPRINPVLTGWQPPWQQPPALQRLIQPPIVTYTPVGVAAAFNALLSQAWQPPWQQPPALRLYTPSVDRPPAYSVQPQMTPVLMAWAPSSQQQQILNKLVPQPVQVYVPVGAPAQFYSTVTQAWVPPAPQPPPLQKLVIPPPLQTYVPVGVPAKFYGAIFQAWQPAQQPQQKQASAYYPGNPNTVLTGALSVTLVLNSAYVWQGVPGGSGTWAPITQPTGGWTPIVIPTNSWSED